MDLLTISDKKVIPSVYTLTIKEFKNKNHLFQTCETGAVEEYQEIEETISPEVLELLVEWIKQ